MNDVTTIVIGMLGIKGLECIRRVYSQEGIAPSLTTMQGGNREPKIIEYEYRPNIDRRNTKYTRLDDK